MGSRALRYLNTPRPIEVAVDERGAPCDLTVAGRRRAVVQIRESWIVCDRWWTDDPIERHYFDVVLDDGRRIELFRSRDRWSRT